MIMVVMKVWCDVLCEELQLGEFNKESLLNMFVLLNLLLLFCSVLKADLVLSKLFCFRLYEITNFTIVFCLYSGCYPPSC